VCADAEWAELGFTIVDPTLPDGAARKLKVKEHPPTSELVTVLKRSPPGDEVTARRWFQVLSRCVSRRIFYLFLFESSLNFSYYLIGFSLAELRELPETPFVPVKSAGDNSIIKRLQPNQCFLRAANSELYSKLFSFVDFGARSNVFLRACGARQEPSVKDFAQLLLAEPRRIYELADGREK
jgi:Protein of unknown function (DUF3684)